ncbi:hypothetical protein C8A00DRAFT_45539 [Chaetomidium leptoderma]|uniref:Uncharacterized protein n=1 Tax=Chaetomidium leptoderma TaxID=669021 RepID=A0AAN6VH62_9PEZI|nr:hypothetical protein C8A00DRAFT_45539 [Chaetomidium leptoderma]
MSLGQLMGIDRGSSRSLQFVDLAVSTTRRPTPQGLWYRINSCDRSHSLMLGLPAGSTDNSFATEESMTGNTSMERLAKLHTVIGGQILERNTNTDGRVYAVAQIIDGDLTSAHISMGQEWWAMPLILHLPYMLRSPMETTHDDSRSACAQSSREVLQRFVVFRAHYRSVWACRHVDYSALVAAMTLLLSYLNQAGNGPHSPATFHSHPDKDGRLIGVVRERMQHVALMNHDKLSQESADVIGQLLPILDSANVSSAESMKSLHLDIPYFGTINVYPGPPVPKDTHTAEANTTFYVVGSAASITRPPAPDPNFGAVEPPPPPHAETTYHSIHMQVDPPAQDDIVEVPVAADADDWIFQGVESSYWSLLNYDIA